MAVVCQDYDRLPERLDRPPIVPSMVVDRPQLGVRFDLERCIPKGSRQGESPLARPQRRLIVAQTAETIGHLAGDLRKTALVNQALCKSFGLAQEGQHPFQVPQTPERKD